MVTLIPRFYDVIEGRIAIDGINIKDIRFPIFDYISKIQNIIITF